MAKTKKQTDITKWIFLGIYLILVGIYYFLTLRNSEDSTKDSSIIANILMWILKVITLQKVEFNYEIIHHITRKLVGHYGYNLILGLFGFLAIYNVKSIGNNALIINLLIGLFIAATSELLQFIPANRAPSYVDILINYMGEVTGILLVYVIVLYKSLKKTNQL